MDMEKQGDSDASRQEPEKANEEGDNTGVGRSYECTFCKRGFTNAQALGGHMNIHRKDKAKAKQLQKNQEETSNKSAKENNHANSRFVSSADHHQILGYQRPQMSYQVYLPSSNPSFQIGNYLPLWRPDANLRLRMGAAAPPADGEGEGEGEGEGRVVDSNAEETKVDLELRLGHDP